MLRRWEMEERGGRKPPARSRSKRDVVVQVAGAIHPDRRLLIRCQTGLGQRRDDAILHFPSDQLEQWHLDTPVLAIRMLVAVALEANPRQLIWLFAPVVGIGAA